MNVNDYLAAVERLERLTRGLEAKRAAVDQQNTAAAAAALATQEAKVAAAAETVAAAGPVGEGVRGEFYRRVAQARVDRAGLLKRITTAETALEEAKATAAKDSWKYKMPAARKTVGGVAPVPKIVTEAQNAIVDLQKELEAHDTKWKPMIGLVEIQLQMEQDIADLNEWAAAGYPSGAMPACIMETAAQTTAALNVGCVRLPLSVATACRIESDGEMDPAINGPEEWGVPEPVEALLDRLVPPPVEESEECLLDGIKGPPRIQRLLDAKRAARMRPVPVAVAVA
jgi:hypothetical protein